MHNMQLTIIKKFKQIIKNKFVKILFQKILNFQIN